MRVLEVAMEIAFPLPVLDAVFKRQGFRPTRDAAMSTSVGGIGPLLRERIIAQAEQGIDVTGVSLLYETTWIQSWFDWGQLHLEKREVPAALREILTDTGLDLEIPLYDGTVVKPRVWKTAYGKATVYFLDAPPITHVVYPSEEDAPHKHPHPAAWGEELRHRQSWLVGRGALLLSKKLDVRPDLVVLSETPTFFAHHRLVKDALQDDPFFNDTAYVFNDHTPMEYAHPVWSSKTLATLRVDASAYVPPGGGTAPDMDVTRFLVGSCDGVYGVSQKHSRIMRAMPSLKDYADKIASITNGVDVAIWQAREIKLAAAQADDALLRVKQAKKAELLDWVWRHYGLWHTWKEQVAGLSVVLWTRRITGYKRIDMLTSLCKDPQMRRQFVESNIVLLIGGRIHQHDDQAQATIYNILDYVSLDPVLKERLVLLDNFNIWMAPRLFQGADAAVMLADDGREASATGFMKAQLNGDIIIASEDGAVAESVTFLGKEKSGQTANGIEVPYVHGHPTPEGLLRAFYTLRGILKEPEKHASMIRAALSAETTVSVERTVQEMAAYYQAVLAKKRPVLNA